jgi:hypothetical protein
MAFRRSAKSLFKNGQAQHANPASDVLWSLNLLAFIENHISRGTNPVADAPDGQSIPTHSKTFCSLISAASASKAFPTTFRQAAFSSYGSIFTSQSGLTIFAPLMIRLDPTIKATDVIAQIWAVGMPAFSNSFVSVAPQRVLVPHVEVNMTPETDEALRSSAIIFPILTTVSTTFATPAVL